MRTNINICNNTNYSNHKRTLSNIKFKDPLKMTTKKNLSILLVFLFVLTSCTESSNTEKGNVEKQDANTELINSVKTYMYGNTKIHFPKIAGMTECYSNPKVQSRSAHISKKSMEIMAFYLPNDIYEEGEELDDTPFIDYFYIYGQSNMKNVTGNRKDLDKVASMMENYLTKLDLDVNDITRDNITFKIGEPALIESYSPNEDSRSLVNITLINSPFGEYINVSIMSFVIVKKKLLTLACYFDYTGKESISKAKAKNDYVILRLQGINKD